MACSKQADENETTLDFKLSSPDIGADSLLSAVYTCDGTMSTLPLNWENPPTGTKSFTLVMDHIAAPDDIHCYWILYNIPAQVSGLVKNATDIGNLGTNTFNDLNEYSGRCSQGPGIKAYTLTIYAVSEELEITVQPSQINREFILNEIADKTIAKASLTVYYSRNVPGNEPVKIIQNLQFAEGPAYKTGNLFFSDIEANTIYRWNEIDGLTVFRENSGGANGLYFDNSGNLIVCEGGNKRIALIDTDQNYSVLADKFEGKAFNEPNDLWISPNGNIYFTDPVFTGTLSQSGEYVYCILASNNELIKVADDLVKPNGIIGNTSGTKLYIADYGASEIYQYSISFDGTLSNKQLFAKVQADGLTIDKEENVYAASKLIMAYTSEGQFIQSIDISETLTNLCFVETETGKFLFATTHNNIYKIQI